MNVPDSERRFSGLSEKVLQSGLIPLISPLFATKFPARGEVLNLPHESPTLDAERRGMVFS